MLTLAAIFSRYQAPLQGRALAATTARTVLATLLDGRARPWRPLHCIPPAPGLTNGDPPRGRPPMLLGAAVYCRRLLAFGRPGTANAAGRRGHAGSVALFQNVPAV